MRPTAIRAVPAAMRGGSQRCRRKSEPPLFLRGPGLSPGHELLFSGSSRRHFLIPGSADPCAVPKLEKNKLGNSAIGDTVADAIRIVAIRVAGKCAGQLCDGGNGQPETLQEYFSAGLWEYLTSVPVPSRPQKEQAFAKSCSLISKGLITDRRAWFAQQGTARFCWPQ